MQLQAPVGLLSEPKRAAAHGYSPRREAETPQEKCLKLKSVNASIQNAGDSRQHQEVPKWQSQKISLAETVEYAEAEIGSLMPMSR
jgi:hypothetical protein